MFSLGPLGDLGTSLLMACDGSGKNLKHAEHCASKAGVVHPCLTVIDMFQTTRSSMFLAKFLQYSSKNIFSTVLTELLVQFICVFIPVPSSSFLVTGILFKKNSLLMSCTSAKGSSLWSLSHTGRWVEMQSSLPLDHEKMKKERRQSEIVYI